MLNKNVIITKERCRIKHREALHVTGNSEKGIIESILISMKDQNFSVESLCEESLWKPCQQ